MKLKPINMLLSFVLLIVFSTNVIGVKAMDTGFSTEELSEEAKTTFVSNISISPLKTEPAKKGVLCFDVNEQGMIAVGQKDFNEKEVCVYTSKGEFLYGYAFDCTQSFGVEWDNENINIYFVRSDVIISLDSEGNILDIKKVQNTIDNNTHSNNMLYSTNRIVGDTEYLIRNDMGIFNWMAASYSQIITIDAMGTERIIYDVNSMQLANMIVTVSIVCVVVLAAIAVITWQFIKLRRSGKTGGGSLS